MVKLKFEFNCTKIKHIVWSAKQLLKSDQIVWIALAIVVAYKHARAV